jgi:hypothetical protein
MNLIGKIFSPEVIQGKSAYEIAQVNGFVGSEKEWLLSLKGSKGDKGEKGDKGNKGAAGYAPVCGIDYFTESDKAKIIGAVLSELDVVEEVSV